MKLFHETTTCQVGALKPRSYYIPFSSPNSSLNIEDSDRVTVLKNWCFEYFDNFDESLFDYEPTEKFELPFNWQIKGFDYNQYTNFFYPIPFDPPYVRKNNPCGVYQTSFEYKKGDSLKYIEFEGVDSCFYLFVNKNFVGYSTVSHSSAEFDITPFLVDGTNQIKVVVLKWCCGTYFEDQDKLRLSGIFRDTYILSRPKDHLFDYKISVDVCNSDGIINVDLDKDCLVSLYDGNILLQEQSGSNLQFKIENAKLWNSESPYLYKLVISRNGEFIVENVGIRKITINDGIFSLNGKPIKLKGVNRHSMTVDGYVENIELMKKDISLFQQYNINAVRTSHYPPHPIFTKLCDIYGIYVLEEADIETHGLETIHYYGDPHHFDDLANNSEYLEIYLHRQLRMYERDKNRQSIIMWSLGNEAGWGENFKKCSDYLRSVDNRPVHYEGNTTRLLPVVEFRDMEYLDVYSRMYPNVDECKMNIDSGIDKPYMLCEYTHAMGNSCGDVKKYWDYIYSENKFLGAFVWEWCNHSIKTEKGYIFGGDFNEVEPCSRYDGNFCVDGLVDTDRRVHPSLLEVGEVYSPIDIEYKNQEIILLNRYDFITLNDFECQMQLKLNGKIVSQVKVDISNVQARDKKVLFNLASCKDENIVNFLKLEGYKTINFIFTNAQRKITTKRQIVISCDYPQVNKYNNAKIETINNEYLINGVNYRATICKNGMISSFKKLDENKNEYKELLKETTNFCLYREPLDNDFPFVEEWKRLRLPYVRTCATNITVNDNKIVVKGLILADIVEPLYDFEIVYTCFENALSVHVNASKRKWVTSVARFGLKFILNKHLENVTYFGRGEGESYSDRNMGCIIDEYNCNVKTMNFDYIKPQDSGSRSNVRMLKIGNIQDNLKFVANKDFCFTATPFDIKNYKRHTFEMDKDTGKVVLHIDAKINGIGSASCGAPLKEEYVVNDDNISIDFDMVTEN